MRYAYAGSGKQESSQSDYCFSLLTRPRLRLLLGCKVSQRVVACGSSPPRLEMTRSKNKTRIHHGHPQRPGYKACKKQKRRCDKGLPECSLCRRTQGLCEYGIAADPQPSASDWGFLQARLTELENRLANSPRAVEQPRYPQHRAEQRDLIVPIYWLHARLFHSRGFELKFQSPVSSIYVP